MKVLSRTRVACDGFWFVLSHTQRRERGARRFLPLPRSWLTVSFLNLRKYPDSVWLPTCMTVEEAHLASRPTVSVVLDATVSRRFLWHCCLITISGIHVSKWFRIFWSCPSSNPLSASTGTQYLRYASFRANTSSVYLTFQPTHQELLLTELTTPGCAVILPFGRCSD